MIDRDRRHIAAGRGGLGCRDAAWPMFRHRVAVAGIGVLAGPAARRERLAGLAGHVDLQRADCTVPRSPGHGRAPGGLLLWPGVALHAVVALLLAWTWRDERRTKGPNT